MRTLPFVAVALLTACAHWERVDIPSLRPPKLYVKAVDPGVSMSTRAVADLQLALERSLSEQTTAFVLTTSTADADAILSVHVGGYGKVKRKWVNWLFGTGLIEGAAQGVLLAQVAGPWAGLGIALEEVLQEGLTWFGGAWAVNTFFTPVILEAKVENPEGAKAWSKTIIVERDRKAIKSLPEDQRKDKEARLRVTAAHAAKDLAVKLAKALTKAARSRIISSP